ncbi:hypothetical protein KIN20_029019 [Parelaphostrongylus tenuis]|uniref:Uncharacterized protein n=1 Tax=Parelaphostrongylus tenuis TaxID=148309 RepID=A0AAD5R212_PARTN|nr:hypothetical protein KIN20_029019 [Parelaphostrongylus tenuis]
MRILTNPARLPMDHVIITFLAAVMVVLGCGVVPTGQVSTRTFNVTGFTTLPVAMVYTDMSEVFAQVVDISTSKRQAQIFVEQLLMETNFRVSRQGGWRLSAGILPQQILEEFLFCLLVLLDSWSDFILRRVSELLSKIP